MSKLTSDDDLWCRRFRPAPDASSRLVCLPHAGGSASFFFPVSTALTPGVDVIAIQYPGRQDRGAETPIGDMAVLADRVHDVLRRQSGMPLTILGHSMGALLGFEVTRRLEADGHGPVRLYASGRRGPATCRDEKTHLRDDAGLIDEVRQLSGTASALLGDDEVMRAALPALRADYRANETYRCAPDVKVNCPISVLTGRDDPKTTLDEANAWALHTSGTFDLHVFEGGHFFLSDQPGAINALLQRDFQLQE